MKVISKAGPKIQAESRVCGEFSNCVGGLAACNLLGGFVQAVLCKKVNEYKQGAGATSA